MLSHLKCYIKHKITFTVAVQYKYYTDQGISKNLWKLRHKVLVTVKMLTVWFPGLWHYVVLQCSMAIQINELYIKSDLLNEACHFFNISQRSRNWLCISVTPPFSNLNSGMIRYINLLHSWIVVTTFTTHAHMFLLVTSHFQEFYVQIIEWIIANQRQLKTATY
jgi:hypothetical protein